MSIKSVKNIRNEGFKLGFKKKLFTNSKHHTNVNNKEIKTQVFLSWFA
jgi:hypothetical protein